MKVLFVMQAYQEAYNGGDRIYDEKLRKALTQTGFDVTVLTLRRQSTTKTLVDAALACVLPTYYRYASNENTGLIRSNVAGHDALVVSHEFFLVPYLRAGCDLPALVVLHNCLSVISGKSGIRGYFRRSSRRLEDKLARMKNTTVGVLSYREQIALADRTGSIERLCLLTPGVGRPFASAPLVLVEDRLFVGGSIEWGPKRRDYLAFSAFHSRSNLPPLAGEEDIIDDGRMRIAVVTDRFSAGFKLKVADLLRKNCVVISMSRVKPDFPPEIDSGGCIFEVEDHSQIANTLKHITENKAEIASAIARVKAKLGEVLTWEMLAQNVSARLIDQSTK